MSLNVEAHGLVVSSFVFVFLGFIAYLIGFSTDSWLISYRQSPFDRVGLHKACFFECRTPYCPGGDPNFVYRGCWEMFAPFNDDLNQFNELVKWITPDWFLLVRLIGIINVPFLIVCLVLSTVSLIITCVSYRKHYLTRCAWVLLQTLLYLTAAILFFSILLCVVMMATFNWNCFSRTWMPVPENNAFGFSFYTLGSSALLLTVALLQVLLAAVFRTLRPDTSKERRNLSEDMVPPAVHSY